MAGLERPALPAIVAQHLEDASSLRSLRSVLVRAADVNLFQLGRTDERLAAHLDGLSVAGEYGAGLSRSALDAPGLGSMFVAAVLAIERRDAAQIEQLTSLCGGVPDAARALSSAFGWVAPGLLRGLTAPLLASEAPMARWLGLAACAQHRVDPGVALDVAAEHPHAALRIRALRAIGELGRVDLLSSCLQQLQAEPSAFTLPAASSAVMLGDRGEAVHALHALALQPGPAQLQALALSLFCADQVTARSVVKQLAAHGTPQRALIKAAGWAGDVQVVPWLFKHMESDANARLAGEAFSFITGVDLTGLQLDRERPSELDSGPDESSHDNNVALDEDDSLPWPDLSKLRAWWSQNADRFAADQRLFAGAPPTPDHCFTVLKEHTQRRRTAAAVYMSLLKPGGVLFNCAAPARRQGRLLAKMEA